MNSRSLVVVVATMVSLGPPASAARAADLRNVLTDFSITSWDTKDGLPEGIIFSLAQGADGYLWVGSSAGLFRFDGSRFIAAEVIAPQSQLANVAVRALCVSSDGSLWIGMGGSRGVARLKEHRFHAYPPMIGAPRAITTLLQDGSGTLWAGGERGLYRLQEDRWEQWVVGDGLPAGAILAGSVDKAGVLLVSMTSGVYRFDGDRQAFQRMPEIRAGGIDLTQDINGDVWTTDPLRGARLARVGASAVVESGRGTRLLPDHAGNLWVATGGQGLWRVRRNLNAGPPSVERATSLTGLLADGVYALLQDRDGNIWAGTTEGLNRLTPRRIKQIVNLGLLLGIEATPDGHIWVGSVDGPVQYSANGEATARPNILHGSQLSALHADQHGQLWVATDQTVYRVTNGNRVLTTWPHGEQRLNVQALTSDNHGDLWFYDPENGLSRRGHEGNVNAFATHSGIAALRADRAGLLWVAFADGQLVTVTQDGTINPRRPDEGFSAAPYGAIYEDERGVVWLGGKTGLTKYSNGHAKTLSLDARLLDRNENSSSDVRVSSIVADTDGSLWLGSRLGVIRLPRAEFDHGVSDRSYRVRSRLYNRTDGIAGTPVQTANNGAVRALDGRLWFITTRGVTIIDPRSLHDGTSSSVVRIEDIAADEVAADARDGAVLLPRTKRLQIDYTVVNLSPQPRTRFRYMLEGFDTGWTSAGSRRQASYTNLAPGNYRFRVAVDAGEGDENTAAATSWSFSIPPVFYQTRWFATLVVAALGLIVVGAWRFHMQHVRQEFAVLLGERARLSREIHDTLLQGLVGIAVQCKTIASLMDIAPASAKQLLESIRGQAERSIRETRLSIWNLRSPALNDNGLAAALEDVGHRLTHDAAISFGMEVSGQQRRCEANIEQQILRIGQEALTNVVRHSGATTVSLHLDYSEDSVHLLVVDNGHGFTEATLESRGLGVISMRERAQQIRGRLTVVSSPETGTRVDVIAPRVLRESYV